MAGRREEYRQEPPFAVQIELVEGCNLRCSFCALNSIRGKEHNFKFMTSDVLAYIVYSIVNEGWNPRLEFAMHGEPTMHPDYVKMIGIARQHAPKLQIMMTSNGGGLLRKPGPIENIEALFEAGLTVLALDNYEDVNIVPKIEDALDGEEGAALMSLFNLSYYHYPRQKEGSPHARRKLSEPALVVIQDISKATKGNHSNLTNQGGNAAPRDYSMNGKRCAKPFREMSIRWDGNVAICCDDWRGVFKAGNVVEDGLEAVWNSVAMNAARRKLYHGQRDFGACKGCNVRSYRTGLLPDKLGKYVLPEPVVSDNFEVAKACKGAPYTEPVRRSWEKGR